MSPTPAKAEPQHTHALQEFKYNRPLVGCRCDPTGRFVVTGAQDNLVQRWDLDGGTATALAGHESWVRAFAYRADGALLVSGGYDGRMIFWAQADQQPVMERAIAAHRGWIRSLAISPDGRLLASAGNDNLVKLWDLADGKPVRELSGHASHVYCVLFHPGGEMLVSGDLKGNIKQWDLKSGQPVREFSAPALHKYDPNFLASIGGARGMDFSTDGNTLAASGIGNVQNAYAGIGQPRLIEFDWDSAKEKKQHTVKEPANGVAWSVRYHADGFWIAGAGGGGGGFLLFWQPDSEHEFFKLKLSSTVHDMDLHPDRLRVAVAHPDALRIWQMTPKQAAG